MSRSDRKEWATLKFNRAVRFARECSRDYRETRDKRFRAISREAVSDARYWRGYLMECKS